MPGKNEMNINDASFKKEVLDSETPVLVDFWADWCGPCRMLAPLIENIAEEYGDKLKVCKVNIDEGQNTASEYKVMNIPTLMIFKKGEVVDKVIGVISKNDLVLRINRYIA